MMKKIQKKLCTVDEAVALIKDGRTVVCAGFCGSGHPEALTAALERRFLQTGKPSNLTLVYAAGQGDGKNGGVNHFAPKGLVKRVIGGHWGLGPKLGKLALDGDIEAYNFPQGTILHLLRDIAAGRPGCITHVGLETFVDPNIMGGRLNNRTTEKLVERVELGGKTWLWYKSFPINVGLIRATSADPFGNLTMEKEVLFGEVLPIAQAVHNCGGIVLAQVCQLLEQPANPQHVKVPGILVDKISIAEPHEHQQTFAESYNPGYCSACTLNEPIGKNLEPLSAGPRRIIASRACDEVPDNAIVNLGYGMPEEVAKIAAERGLLDNFTLTVESGPIGGIPAGGLSFGASLHPHAIVDQPAQFDFYDGRGLDIAYLGAAQVDAVGNVNVSKFGHKLAGIGGFVNITQTAKKLVFCGTFTANGLEIEVENRKIKIIKEGCLRKFISEVEQISFSSERARQVGQEVLYITERAVFCLAEKGIELIEIAPGIDIQKHVLDLMDFKPTIKKVGQMPEHVFK